MSILQQVHGIFFLITNNATHRIRKARKFSHGGLLGHHFLLVPHARIILGRLVKGLLHEVGTDISQTLPPFLYFLISPKTIYPFPYRTRIIQFKLHSVYSTIYLNSGVSTQLRWNLTPPLSPEVKKNESTILEDSESACLQTSWEKPFQSIS